LLSLTGLGSGLFRAVEAKAYSLAITRRTRSAVLRASRLEERRPHRPFH